VALGELIRSPKNQHVEAFSRRPDVLDLIAKIEGSTDIRLMEQESAFGKTSDQVALYRGVALGLTSRLMPYHSSVGNFDADSAVILLAPALRDSRRIPRVDADAYESALSRLLSGGLASWTLICERDCDQESRRAIDAASEEANTALRELFDFLRGVPGSACPTFIIAKGEQASASDGDKPLI